MLNFAELLLLIFHILSNFLHFSSSAFTTFKKIKEKLPIPINEFNVTLVINAVPIIIHYWLIIKTSTFYFKNRLTLFQAAILL